jgi:hypothetical protein
MSLENELFSQQNEDVIDLQPTWDGLAAAKAAEEILKAEEARCAQNNESFKEKDRNRLYWYYYFNEMAKAGYELHYVTKRRHKPWLRSCLAELLTYSVSKAEKAMSWFKCTNLTSDYEEKLRHHIIYNLMHKSCRIRREDPMRY